MTVRYATLAYGGNGVVYRQASLLVMSLLAHAPEPHEIVVFTDRPERFEWLAGSVRVRRIEPGELEAWCGAARFSMRQKLEAVRAALPEHGALAFLDADTIVAAPLGPFVDALAAGAVLMHTREFELGSSRRPGNRALWDQLRGRRFGRWQFRPRDAMWNSGVLALSASDAGLLDEALTLYDTMAAAGIRHFATEQLVLGLVLGRTGRVREASRWFTHYWGNKESYDRETIRRLDDVRARGLAPREAAEELRRDPIRLPAEVRPRKWEKVRRWLGRRLDRIRRSIRLR